MKLYCMQYVIMHSVTGNCFIDSSVMMPFESAQQQFLISSEPIYIDIIDGGGGGG
jgi:hypothetical protein